MKPAELQLPGLLIRTEYTAICTDCERRIITSQDVESLEAHFVQHRQITHGDCLADMEREASA